MPDSRTMVKEKVLGDKKVDLPVRFEDISMLQGVSVNDALGGILGKIRDERKVVTQYRDFKEKTAGIIFGFYINHSVRQQNVLNDRLMDVFEELEKVTAQTNELAQKILEAKEELEALTGER